MAKVKMPLMSASARGKLADSVVHFPWKGINAVREYVIPTNPRTAAQTTQRNRLTAAVAEWHGALYTAADKTAWNRLAGVINGIMTGYNAMCKSHIDEAIKGNTWTRMRNVIFTDVTATGFQVRVTKASGAPAPRCRVGKSKTFFDYEDVMVDQTGDLWLVNIPNLTTKTLYYVYIYVGASGSNWGRTGIYAQRTS